MNKITNLIKRMLGGRPMKLERFAFIDVGDGDVVCYWTDTLGRRWLASNKWALFRVPLSVEEEKHE